MAEMKSGNLKVLVIEIMQTVRQLMATTLAGEYKELLLQRTQMKATESP